MDPNAKRNKRATGTEENNYLLPDSGYKQMKANTELDWLETQGAKTRNKNNSSKHWDTLTTN